MFRGLERRPSQGLRNAGEPIDTTTTVTAVYRLGGGELWV